MDGEIDIQIKEMHYDHSLIVPKTHAGYVWLKKNTDIKPEKQWGRGFFMNDHRAIENLISRMQEAGLRINQGIWV